MAADWIKMRTDMYRDPRVCIIADSLIDPAGDLARYVGQNNQCDMSVTRNVMRNATVGALVTVWGIMRVRGKRDGQDLICPQANTFTIDDMADMPGLGRAMVSVSWVRETKEGLVFPNFFEDYNVDPTEKKASSSAERQRRYRERNKGISDVTRDVTRDVTVTHREEKRREEKEKEKEHTQVDDLLSSVPEQVVKDFKQLRKTKKAPITQTALEGIQREAAKAGLTMERALTICCERGWTGFKADWMADKTQPATPKRPPMREL